VYKSNEIIFEFVNQVRGDTFDGLYHPRTRNGADGGIQCNPNGPDKCPHPIKVPFLGQRSKLTALLENHKVTAGVTGQPDLYMQRPARKRGTRKRAKHHQMESTSPGDKDEQAQEIKNQEEHELAKQWRVQKKRVVDDTQLQLLVVSSVNYNQATTMSPDDKSLFYVPTLASVNDSSTPAVQYYGLTNEVYKELSKKSNDEDGIDINVFDNLVSTKSSASHHLIDCHKIQPSPSDNTSTFYGYTKVYAGEGAPTLDDNDKDVQTFNIPNSDTTIKCKFVNASEDHGHVPLSVGLTDSSFHGISIQPSYIELINKAVGKCGLFTNRSRSGHHGSLSYVGPRAANSCSQPTPSEGPKEQGYWYYRQKMNAFFWPFVLHLMMYLASNITLLSYYQYTHLSKLLPLSNEDPLRQDFSDIGILTQDYNCKPHVDENDALDAMDAMFKQKLGLLSISEYLTDVQRQQAKLALDHVEHWGLGTPTTCGYQVIVDEVSSAAICNTKIKSKMNNVKSDDEEVEIIQYFCCMGLGTCFRIKNYWTHMFLAYCFSHYTSVAIFVKGNKVFFGKYPGITMFAWGKGRSKKKFGTYQPVVDGHRVRRSRRNQS